MWAVALDTEGELLGGLVPKLQADNVGMGVLDVQVTTGTCRDDVLSADGRARGVWGEDFVGGVAAAADGRDRQALTE